MASAVVATLQTPGSAFYCLSGLKLPGCIVA